MSPAREAIRHKPLKGIDMSVYNKIVVAVDLSSDSQKVIDVALKVASGDASKIDLVHVVEPIAAA